MKALLEKPPRLTAASRYTVLNGAIYLGVGTLLIVWPRMTQTLFIAANRRGEHRARTARGQRRAAPRI